MHVLLALLPLGEMAPSSETPKGVTIAGSAWRFVNVIPTTKELLDPCRENLKLNK